MGVVVSAGTAVSQVLNSKSADQVTGTYQFAPFDGDLTVAARGSATGMNLILVVNGQTLISDLPVPYTGTAGGISLQDHEVASFPVPAGARVEFYLRNTTGGTLTTDYILFLDEA